MKLTKIITLAALSATVLCSCVSKDVKGTGFDMNVNKPVIVDYKGQSFGSNIPGWVIDAADGNTKNVKSGLGLKDCKVWILQNDGQDLDQLKLWTDQIDGRAQIASGIEQSVADLVSASLEANQNIDKTTKEKYVKDFSMRMTNLTLNGLEKSGDYWTKTKTLKDGIKKAKSEADYKTKFTYLVVFSMDEKLYKTQLQTAMNDIDENDDQSAMLRDIITSKLMEEVELYAADAE